MKEQDTAGYTPKPIRTAALHLFERLNASRPKEAARRDFLVSFGRKGIVVMAPARHDCIPDTFEGIAVEYRQNDCKFRGDTPGNAGL